MSTAATASSSAANAYAVLGAPRARISTQVAAAFTAGVPPNPTIDDLPRIVVGNRSHNICRISPLSDEDSDSATLAPSPLASTLSPYKRLRLANTNVPKAKITTLKDLCVASVVSADLLFTYFENVFLQQIFQYHSTEVASEVLEALVTAELHSATSKIHLSFDLWSSPNIYAFMAVTGHFVDDKGTLQSRLLAFPQHHGNHSGKSLAETLIGVVDRY
ncbi:transposase-like protein [Colletotrichum kahawae]|uniref:Transposase-like protein n=1 Tax=Colletotrichum kahawae TaxID=34407 RepID=A0AAE0D8F4_COLKA|nr:transposase-like protein [Colletotrichum kahawae]